MAMFLSRFVICHFRAEISLMKDRQGDNLTTSTLLNLEKSKQGLV
jgi:hypothetical protein